MASIDPETGEIVALFHPRRDDWNDHFRLLEDGRIVPTNHLDVPAIEGFEELLLGFELTLIVLPTIYGWFAVDRERKPATADVRRE